MSETAARIFFGDAERDFCLTPALIIELERRTDAGVGALCKRLFANEFTLTDIAQTIRLALIGGGETPERADELVQTYVLDRPLMQSYPIAVSILEKLWFGTTEPEQETTNETP